METRQCQRIFMCVVIGTFAITMLLLTYQFLRVSGVM